MQALDFDAAQRQLTIAVDFVSGSRFAYAGVGGEHPAHDTRIKRLRHLNPFQHECFLDSTTGTRLIGLYRMRKTGRYGFLRPFI